MAGAFLHLKSDYAVFGKPYQQPFKLLIQSYPLRLTTGLITVETTVSKAVFYSTTFMHLIFSRDHLAHPEETFAVIP